MEAMLRYRSMSNVGSTASFQVLTTEFRDAVFLDVGNEQALSALSRATESAQITIALRLARDWSRLHGGSRGAERLC